MKIVKITSENFHELGGLKGVTEIIEEKLFYLENGEPLLVKDRPNTKNLGEYEDCYSSEELNSIFIRGSKDVETLDITEIEYIEILDNSIYVQFNKYRNGGSMLISYKN